MVLKSLRACNKTSGHDALQLFAPLGQRDSSVASLAGLAEIFWSVTNS